MKIKEKNYNVIPPNSKRTPKIYRLDKEGNVLKKSVFNIEHLLEHNGSPITKQQLQSIDKSCNGKSYFIINKSPNRSAIRRMTYSNN